MKKEQLEKAKLLDKEIVEIGRQLAYLNKVHDDSTGSYVLLQKKEAGLIEHRGFEIRDKKLVELCIKFQKEKLQTSLNKLEKVFGEI